MKKILHHHENGNYFYEKNIFKFKKRLKIFCFSIIGILSLMCFSSVTAHSKIVYIEKKKNLQKINPKTFKNKNSSINNALILQKCLDSEELIPYLSKNADGKSSKIFIMQYPIAFSANLNLSKFGVTFLSRQEISLNKVESFFIFKVFSIYGDTAKVKFDYYNNTLVSQVVEITANLQKSGTEWKINDSTFNHK